MTQRAHPTADVSALEAAAASTRAGFACMFSTSAEYEEALIAQRRAQGRYGRRTQDRQGLFLIAAILVLAATVLVVVL